MSVPATIPSFVGISDGVGTITLSHGQPTSSPSLYGYKYFRSNVSLAAVQALATADTGLLSPTGLVTDVESQVVSGQTFSRLPISPPITFNDIESFGTYYYAAVAWNSVGGSSYVTATVSHVAASTPTMVSVINTETVISVLFNQTIVSASTNWGVGFTITVNGVVQFTSAVNFSSPSTINFTMVNTIRVGDTVTVAFVNTNSDITNTLGSAKAANFTQTSTNNSNCAALLASVIALNPANPQVVSLVFSKAVTASPYLTGLSATVNSTVTAISSVVAAGDPRQLLVTFAGGFKFSDVVVLSYNAGVGNWASGYVIPSFSVTPTNASKIGTPLSNYPLSSVIEYAPVGSNGGTKATIGVQLNSVDIGLVGEYGPVNVDFGGTFGITTPNPSGVMLTQDIRSIYNGLSVTKTFYVLGQPAFGAAAANDWLNQIATRIGTSLAAVRTLDQTISLNALTIVQV